MSEEPPCETTNPILPPIMTGTGETTINKKIWGGWATFGLGVLVFAASTIVQIIVASIFVAIELFSDPQLNIDQLSLELSTNGSLLALSICASAIVSISLIVLFIYLRKGASISEYLGLSPISGKALLILFVICVGLISIWDSMTLILERPLIPQIMVDAYTSCQWPMIFWIAIVFAAPVFEEIFFRGFLFEGFRKSRIGDLGTVIITALTWAIIHTQYGYYEMSFIFLLGILLGVVRIKTGSIWGCLFIHALNNLVATIALELVVRGLIETTK